VENVRFLPQDASRIAYYKRKCEPGKIVFL